MRISYRADASERFADVRVFNGLTVMIGRERARRGLLSYVPGLTPRG